MGMAASQARLLTLTARLHDVELKAQNLMAQKLSLATQKDGLYQDYCDALEATALKVAYWGDAASTELVDANFDSVCNYNPRRVQQYALRDNQTGLMLVTEETKDLYDSYGKDKYSFAWAMLGLENDFGWNNEKDGYSARNMGAEIGIENCQGVYENSIDNGEGKKHSLFMTQVEQAVFDKYENSNEDLRNKYQDILDAQGNPEKQKDALATFRKCLYENYSEEIFNGMNRDKQATPDESDLIFDASWEDMRKEFNYYINLWTAINEAGGCTTVDNMYTNGKEGNQWFQNMVEAGLVTIQVFDENSFEKEWSDTSFATSTNNNYLQEVQDETFLKKAEAEYEHELDIINQKDTKFDNELSKLETERTSITTEIESIGKVKEENIERTFGIFS